MLRRIAFLTTILCAALAPYVSAQTKATLNVSETLFGVVSAINACGYNQDMANAEPVRRDIRMEIDQQLENSASARYAKENLCTFYRDHQQGDPSRDLAQYISLALYLGEPPAFVPNVKEADLPPDAAYVLGIQHELQNFYTAANLHSIWLRHQKDYEALIDANNEDVAKMLVATDVYLKIPVGGFQGRRLTILIEPMAGSSQSNARNYDTEYYIVLSPENGKLKIDQIRHTYLHFILDPMTQKRGTTMKRLAPLLDSIKSAPIDESYKKDITLLVTESLIRAIEARTEPGKSPEAEQKRLQKVDEAAREGFILTPHFYEQLIAFEKDPRGMQDAYGDWLYYINVDKEQRRASQIQFAKTSQPDVVRQTKPRSQLEDAEKLFASGDYARAKEITQKLLDSKQGDPGRAYFLLARIAFSSKDLPGAQSMFEQAIHSTREAPVVAWSNISLGRISDLKGERDAALKYYRAALDAGDSTTILKAAAERGLKQPYAPPAAQKPQETNDKE